MTSQMKLPQLMRFIVIVAKDNSISLLLSYLIFEIFGTLISRSSHSIIQNKQY
ncbi:transmembrane protein, putative (macronuclear) [Tetrahymena thermophila SB210]|uniref:Transmembrane protein, putative n=1 Tax=Tetrahymena thermophila (strain SB210) TaxID=312017 RepID=Q22XS8_TETTS|nr:transmembrane protein, putative [Tetrahymena thermophila SB210]EAR90093.1 transmembrane protein, putative [Tetrahymena thermophila SB210]|eukprot:XP_001010338.1 transmembrane protein, putative [Tetrahymena thermophila SB210]